MDTKKLENLPNPNGEIEKGSSHIVVELIEYEHDAIVNKTIMKRATGSVNAMSFSKGEGLDKKTIAFDTYLQIIDGSANIEVDGEQTVLNTGDGILIPAHKPSQIIPNGRFKLIVTVIKSGYEDL